MTASLAYRKAEPHDLPFVVAAWKSSFRKTFLSEFEPRGHARCSFPEDHYDPMMRDSIARILQRPGVDVVVAYHPGETERGADLYGFLCAELGGAVPFVHYVYCKQAARRLGIARGMFHAVGVDPAGTFAYTYLTLAAQKLLPKVPRALWVSININQDEEAA